MATASPYNLVHDLLNLLQKHQNSLQLQIKIMENSSSESQHKKTKSQEGSFERLLEDDFRDYVQENRTNSTSIISDPEGNVWNVRCNDRVVEEIREEEERKLEGKKLDFDEVCSDDDHDEQQQEVRSLGSSVSDGQESSLLNSSSCLSDDKKVDLEDFGANLGQQYYYIASPWLCVEEKMDLVEEKKSGGHFAANLGEKSGCDEKMKKKMDPVEKKSEDFDANLEKKRSGRCRFSKWFTIVTMGVVLGMFILMSFDVANFGKDEGFLVPT